MQQLPNPAPVYPPPVPTPAPTTVDRLIKPVVTLMVGTVVPGVASSWVVPNDGVTLTSASLTLLVMTVGLFLSLLAVVFIAYVESQQAIIAAKDAYIVYVQRLHEHSILVTEQALGLGREAVHTIRTPPS